MLAAKAEGKRPIGRPKYRWKNNITRSSWKNIYFPLIWHRSQNTEAYVDIVIFIISFRDLLSSFNKLCTSKRLCLSFENSFQRTAHIIRSIKLSTRDLETFNILWSQSSKKFKIRNYKSRTRITITNTGPGQIQSEPKKIKFTAKPDLVPSLF